tara:strand:- start:2912 stop:3061 length:150 start_codon:yes stop_codon:yes gene_type:complete
LERSECLQAAKEQKYSRGHGPTQPFGYAQGQNIIPFPKTEPFLGRYQFA